MIISEIYPIVLIWGCLEAACPFINMKRMEVGKEAARFCGCAFNVLLHDIKARRDH
jgi:hypothetical protein